MIIRRRFSNLFALAFLLAGGALNAGTEITTWHNVAITGGGFVSGIIFHPNQQNLVYARTDVGGAYRWDDAGQQWIPLNDDIGGLQNEFVHLGVLSFAVDLNDASRLYLACGQYTWDYDWNPDGIILRSTDRGATWTRTTLPVKLGGNEDGRNTGERLQVDPNDGRLLFLGTNQDGLWKSADHGATWAKATTFPATSCTLVLFDKTTGSTGSATQTIYVGVNSTASTGLYRSRDGGATWDAVPGQPAGLIPHHADIGYEPGPGTLYVAYSNALGPNGVNAGAVWKMDITSHSWTDITPAAGSWGYGGLSVAASDSRTLVVSTIDRWSLHDEIYRTTDAGYSWSGILQSGSLDTSSAPWAAASTPHWTADVKIDPFNPARAMFVTGYGLFASDDISADAPVWAFRDAGLEETVPTMFVSPPSGPHLVSTVGDVDGFRHDNVDVTPASRHIPMEGTNSSIDFAENNPSVMARTFHSATRGAWSADGGATWTLFGSAPYGYDNGGTIAVSADGSRLVWTQSGSTACNPYYSTDHGANWMLCSGAPAGLAPVADRSNASKFYIYDGNAGRAYASTDGGATFNAAASVPKYASPMRAVPGIEGNLWLPAGGSGLLRSANSGITFTAVPGVQEAYQVGFGKAAAGQTHPAVFIWGKIADTVGFFRSDDAGATWTRINDDLHQFGYINWISGDPRIFRRVYFATSGRGIVYGEAIPPAIVTQPLSRTVRFGQNADFTITASGSPEPAYRWQRSANGGSTWSNLADAGSYSGTTTTALTVSSSTVAMSGDQFRCVASNGLSPDAISSAATLTVNKAVPVITWAAPAPITYGTPLSATQLNATANVPGTFVYTPAAGTVLTANTRTLKATFTPTDTLNYATVSTTRSLLVNKAVPVITWATPAPITYGTPLSATQLNATANVPGTFVYSPAAGTVLTANIRTLNVKFTPADTTDYTKAAATQKLFVMQVVPVITWATPAPITYGTPLSATQLNATANVPGTFVYSPAAGTVLTANTRTLKATFTPTDTLNYATVSTTRSLLVNKAVPVITWATPAPITYGTPLSATQLNATANVPGTFVYSPAAGTVLTANIRTLNVKFTPADTTDYTKAAATQKLFVMQVVPVITWATPAPITYGTPLSATQLNATANVPGTFVYSPAAGTVLTANTRTLKATFTPTDTLNYATVSTTRSLVVNKAVPVITWATPAPITYGTPLSPAQLNATADVPGSFVYSPAAGAVLSVGAHTLKATFTPNDTTDYTTATATRSLTVNPAN